MVKNLDCRGMQCPQPVIQAKDALLEIQEGELTIVVDNEAACANVTQFAVNQGLSVSHIEENGAYNLRLVKKAKKTKAGSVTKRSVLREKGQSPKMVVYINSDTIGVGDDDLGRVLMAAFIDTLSHFAKQITHIIFLNAGVKFACRGSSALEQLKSLEETGVEILSCGTCLGHFGLTDRLSAGKVSNLFSIIDVFSQAEKIVRP